MDVSTPHASSPMPSTPMAMVSPPSSKGSPHASDVPTQSRRERRRGGGESALDSPTAVPVGSPAPSSNRDTGSMPRQRDGFAADFTKRDSVANINRDVQDLDVRVFQEEPVVKVLGGRSEDAWPTRYVEYDVELNYKNFRWQVEIPKSTLYGLWFFVKSKMHGIHSRRDNNDNAASGAGGAYSGWSFPPMRKLFLANAEKSISPEMVALVQQYLDAVVKIPALLHTSYIVEMFQVSNSTFDDEEGYTSVREGWLRVRMWLKGNQENVRINRGAVTCDNECFNCMCVVKRVHFKSKKWRWVALKHSSIAVYPSIQDTRASEVFLFDQKFSIERGIHSAGSNTALLVSNSTYVMQVEAKTKQAILKWANDIRKTAEKSDWSQNHRDDSFAIPRNPNQMTSYAKWYVDGKDAFEGIYETLRSARKEIFIAGWWICPTIHLLRPAALYPHSRLDHVLKKKAEEGVKIYILMYKEVSVALTLNSNFSKQVFRRLHPNVSVLRDPDFLMKHLGMWSHHEKIVSVDQKVTFVGGLDLCFGRWDTGDHALFDEPTQRTNFVGKDYSNPRVKDFVEVNQPDKDMIDRNEVPRMPWHDCHCRLEGQPARDVARHFIQRWNYSVSTRSKTSKLHHLVPMKDYQRIFTTTDNSNRLLTRRLQKAVHAVRALNGIRKASSSQDVSSNAAKDRRMSYGSSPNLSAPHNGKTPTIPENSASLPQAVDDDEPARGFNAGRRMSKMFSDRNMINDDVDVEDEEEDDNQEDEENDLKVESRGHPVSCQVLRSLSLWSGGCPTERSIQNAYLRLISSANHFIYIENQFFVSGLEGDHGCANRIANALVERIRRAAANKEPFRVMIVMPLLPAFPGKVDDKESSSLRGVMYWQYRSICRGENSIYHTLFKELDDPFEYIAFFGLRTHNIVNNHPETEEVYIHSKLMIVDDRSVIIGSANINERSMNGDRDSEIAVVIDDAELDDTVKIANSTLSVGKFAHSFRMKLFEEHFGLAPGSDQYKQYMDPVNNDVWFTMQEHAMRNCQIYESVFGCLPSDNVLSFKQISTYIENTRMNDPSYANVNTNGTVPNGIQQRNSPRRARADSGTSSRDNSHHQPSPNRQQQQQPQQRKATKIVEQEEPITGEQVELETPSSPDAASPPMSPTSDDLEPMSPSDDLIALPERQGSDISTVITVNMRQESQILDHKDELNGVQGHIVYFPLKFLADEPLEPKLFPAELFQ
ncbi:hypothetical protein Poli38472_006223 [Pythium oligandrum]|uniref:Phospholipase n=1 Tax=Pythium oligandrum TaxID=41045 RepID=A0A8K1CSI0_PYTOL|nr:hypothetical protein Poli38472_006223 [Pythium oligandrum]|eukprot:TMW68755.1 hypothetical protein Poli38472_006223 [Pythium oligandrum]